MGKEQMLKQQSNALSNRIPPARKSGFTVKIGSGCGEVRVVLGNNIKSIVLYVKQSPFNGKKDLVTGCLVGFSSSTKENQKEALKYVMDSTECFDGYRPCRKRLGCELTKP